jgi:DNA-directed RNA polymerase specialized sigma24 family protein
MGDAEETPGLGNPESTRFPAGEYEVVIENDRLAEELLRLTELQRQIVLLTECCGESDNGAASLLGSKRSTVQYQHAKAINILRSRMGVGNAKRDT